jgi:hypothetical protein
VTCAHLDREFFRKPYEGPLLVVDRCHVCRQAIARDGHWVPHDEVRAAGLDPATLRFDPYDAVPRVNPNQLGLFAPPTSGGTSR